jgi:hypothetical protein
MECAHGARADCLRVNLCFKVIESPAGLKHVEGVVCHVLRVFHQIQLG